MRRSNNREQTVSSNLQAVILEKRTSDAQMYLISKHYRLNNSANRRSIAETSFDGLAVTTET